MKIQWIICLATLALAQANPGRRLLNACRAGNWNEAKHLLENGANVNYKDNRNGW